MFLLLGWLIGQMTNTLSGVFSYAALLTAYQPFMKVG